MIGTDLPRDPTGELSAQSGKEYRSAPQATPQGLHIRPASPPPTVASDAGHSAQLACPGRPGAWSMRRSARPDAIRLPKHRRHTQPGIHRQPRGVAPLASFPDRLLLGELAGTLATSAPPSGVIAQPLDRATSGEAGRSAGSRNSLSGAGSVGYLAGPAVRPLRDGCAVWRWLHRLPSRGARLRCGRHSGRFAAVAQAPATSHPTIHAQRPWLTLDQLRGLLRP